MKYKNKLIEFIQDLNCILDYSVFSNRTIGRFVLEIDEFNIEVDHCIKISLRFIDGDKYHLFYYRKYITYSDVDIDSFFRTSYFDILVYGIMSNDSVGLLSDAIYNNHINVISFKTLLSEGLSKLK